MRDSAVDIAHSNYRFHGLAVRLCWDDPVLVPPLQTLCRSFGLRVVPACPCAPQITLRFVIHASRCPIPPDACHVAEDGDLHAWQTAHHLYLCAGEDVVQLTPSAGTAIGTLRPVAESAPYPLRKDLVLYSLLGLVRPYGLYALHAAGVATAQGGVLLVGPSDSGKSTLAFSLVRQGWGYLSDDALLVQACGKEIAAFPLRQEACLDPEALHAFPDLVAHWPPSPPGDAVKQRVDVAALYPDQVQSVCLPRVLIFPRIVAAPVSQLRPVGPAEALGHLIRQSILLGLEPHLARPHLAMLTRLVQQTRPYILHAGQDLGRQPARIAPLLTALLGQAGDPRTGGMVR